jgi:hypothetical protein
MCDYFFLYSIANGKVEQVTMKKTTMKKIVKLKIAKQTQNLSLIWMLIYQVRLIHVML